jgi:HAE1 family hydrophobic/amphiphilic exporter-1
MSPSEIFIRRPVMTTLVMLGILLFGIMGYRTLPVSDLPNVDFPTVSVSASLPGASADTMASAVATPLERSFSSIDGLDSMTSVSTLGNTSVTLQFNLSRKINDVPPDILTAINRATPLLPPGMPQPPSFRKVNPADSPIILLVLTSPTLPLYELDLYGETIMAQRISMISGVAQVNVFGSQKYAVHVQVNPDTLASRGIGIDAVEKAITRANVNQPLGTLYGAETAFTVQASGQLLKADAYRDLVVTYRNGSPVRLKDIGQVIDDVEDNKSAAWFVDKNINERSLILAVQRQPGANAVEVSDAVKALLPRFQTFLPPSVNLGILYDRAESIRNSVADVKMTIYIALVLVVLVIFLFLRNLPATIIPSLAVPLSLIGTFSVMYLLDFSVDNLSLMALTLSIGFVVDDAIVVLENIVRHMEKGETAFDAALKGSKEIGFTIVSMTLSLAAVFIPLLFMGGIVGRLFREFSVTIFVAILISGFVSLTLTPMLCSRFLRPPAKKEEHGRVYNLLERFFDRILHLYERALQWALHHRRIMLASFLVTLMATGYFLVTIPKGFIPDEDTDQISGTIEAAQGSSYDAMVRNQQKVVDILRLNTNVGAFYTSVGGFAASSQGGQNYGRLSFRLKPKKERDLDVYGVIRQMNQSLAGIPEVRVFLQNPPSLRIGGRLTRSQYQYTLQSPNMDDLYNYAPAFEAKLRALRSGDDPMLEGVTSDLQIRNPQANVVIDRDKAAVLGVDVQQIEDALFSAYGTKWISSIYAPEDQYKVLLELEPRFQRDPSAMSRLYITSSNGQLVPLAGLARIEENVGPQSISHSGQFSAVTISFNVKQGVPLSTVVDSVTALSRESLPATVSGGFQGTAQAFQSSIAGLGMLLVVAILVIYLVLGILYESFIHPITILSGLPSAGLGALVTLYVFHQDLNVYSFVGLILLIGIVKKNAIMQIDFALEAQRVEGKAPLDAIVQGCLTRFRPIMMTTMSALMAALPIALGASARRPLGLAVVGGLIFSQLVTLFLTPIFYYYMDAAQTGTRNLLRRWHLMPSVSPKPAAA